MGEQSSYKKILQVTNIKLKFTEINPKGFGGYCLWVVCLMFFCLLCFVVLVFFWVGNVVQRFLFVLVTVQEFCKAS